MQKNKLGVLIFLMSIALILAIGGCTDDENPTGGDGIGPEIVSVYPANNSTGVSVATPIMIIFSEQVDINTFAPSTLRPGDTSFTITPPTAVNVSYKGDTVFIIPYYNLYFGQTYTVTVNDYIKDLDGNKLEANATWSFSTGEEILPLSINNIWVYYDSLGQLDTTTIYDTSYYYFFDTLVDTDITIDSIVKDSVIEEIFLITDPVTGDTIFIDTIWDVFNVTYKDTAIDTTITLDDSLYRTMDTVYNIVSPTETTLIIFSNRASEDISAISRFLTSFNGDSVRFNVTGKYKWVIEATTDINGDTISVDTTLKFSGSSKGTDVYATKMTNFYHEGDPVFLNQLFTGKVLMRNDVEGLYIVGAISQHDTLYEESLYLKYPVTVGDTWNTIGFMDDPYVGLTLIDDYVIAMECISDDTTYIIPADTAYTITGDMVVYDEQIIQNCIAYQATFEIDNHTYVYIYYYYPNFGMVGYSAQVDYFFVSADTLIDTTTYVDTLKIDSFNFDIQTTQVIDTFIDTTYKVTPGIWNLRRYGLN